LKSMIQNGEFTFKYDDKNFEMQVKGIIFEYGLDKIEREKYKGSVVLVYKKDFNFRVDI
jgi:hypothetical protein